MFKGEPKNIQLAMSNLTETVVRLESQSANFKNQSSNNLANAEENNAK